MRIGKKDMRCHSTDEYDGRRGLQEGRSKGATIT